MSGEPVAGRRARVTGAVAVVGAMTALGGCGEEATAWSAWRAAGPRTIEVSVPHRPCDRVTETAVSEHPDRVVITAHRTRRGRDPCVELLVGTWVRVRLEEPLGSRAVVDGMTGRRVPQRP